MEERNEGVNQRFILFDFKLYHSKFILSRILEDFWMYVGFGPSKDGSPGRGYPPERDLNAEESSTNEPHKQKTVFIGNGLFFP